MCLRVHWCAGKSDALLAVSVTASSSDQPSVLKEGVLEKKGHSAAFLSWPKRVVRVTKGELYYAKPEDPEVCGQCSMCVYGVWCGVVCVCGVVWCVCVVWCDVVCGVVWCGMVWCGVHGVMCGVVWYGMVWYGVVCVCVVWCGVWCGVV